MGKPKQRLKKRYVKLNQENEMKQSPEDDTMSVRDNKTIEEDKPAAFKTVIEDININKVDERKSKIMKKKDKRKDKRNKLLSKLTSLKSLKKKAREAKERSQAVIVGDMQPLMDALPQVSDVVESKHDEKLKINSKAKTWSNKKWRTKRKEELLARAICHLLCSQYHRLQDINLFQKVLHLPEYQMDPKTAVENHIESMIKGNFL